MDQKNNAHFVIAAIGDIHVKEGSSARYRELFAEMEAQADVLVLCGDLTDSGMPAEAAQLGDALATVKAPILGVLGNHDHHNGHAEEIKKIASDAKMIFLEDRTYEIGEVGFAGAKGFGGGFGRYMLSSFGEPTMKQFAEESVREALKLEADLQKLKTHHKIAVLHYAPVVATVHGEPPEIYPFLGSSRLGEVIERFGVQAVVHGHAHYGTFEGALRGGARVYNCAQEVVRRHLNRPYALIEVPRVA